MKFVKNDLPSEMASIEIELFYDCHIGSKKCDYKLIQERIDRVKNTENVYAILGGDLINNSILNSVAEADLYENPLNPNEQITQLINLFAPIKDKILGVTSGNHCRRTYKTDGIDLIYLFCSKLGITDKYDYASCLLFVRFGKQIRNRNGKGHPSSGRKMCYTIYMTHGDGANGKTIGSKANSLKKSAQFIDADVIVKGHSHDPFAIHNMLIRTDPQNNSAFFKDQLCVNASASLDWETYAEIYSMQPTSKQSPRIILDGTKRVMVAMI